MTLSPPTYISFTPGTTIHSADANSNNTATDTSIQAIINALSGTLANNFTFLATSNANTPLILQLPTAPSTDRAMVHSVVVGDTSGRIAQYIRGSDGYGGLRGGVGGGSYTANLYAQAGGWQIDQTLTVIGYLYADVIHTVSSTGGLTILVGTSGFVGVKTTGGTKLFEGKLNTNFMIGGTYQTASGTSTISTSQTFDGFDYAECYVCDDDYESGTVVCLDDEGKMTRCTHYNCPGALIVSKRPAYMAGADDEAPAEDHVHPLALVGRVKVLAVGRIARGKHVVSNGDGRVRALPAGSRGYALGVAITETDNDGRVGILMRPMYCKGA